MNFRVAKMTDAQLLFDWRNDPETRAESSSTGEFDFDSHVKWLEKSLQTVGRIIYIFEENSVPVGTVRVDRDKGVSIFSWTVAPAQRRRGVGKTMLAKAVRYDGGAAKAEIKSTNIASQKIAEACGFKHTHTEGDLMHYEIAQKAVHGL